jgi:hypothetical protein
MTIRGADERVFEYMRRVIASAPIDFNYRSEMNQHGWAELVGIWYRHRNCMAHQGGCVPEDSSHCRNGDAKCRSCRAAREEMIEKHGDSGIDDYRRALRDIAQFCLAHELA